MHSAYIVQYGDMPGFSQQTKDSLAAVIANQKKKLFIEQLDNKYDPQYALLAVARILRLAILFNVKRDNIDISGLTFIPKGEQDLLIETINERVIFYRKFYRWWC